MTVLAVIPARAGSKGVEKKNLQKVGDRSLIRRAVTAALESGVVDHVCVSTDSEDFAEEARNAGAEVPFLRPAELASDEAPVIPVIRHAIEEFEAHAAVTFTTVVLTEPTVPFRTGRHIAEAVSRYEEGDCHSVISVCPLERKPHNIFVKRDDGLLERYVRDPVEDFARRQDMARTCRLSSNVYVFGRDDFLRTGELLLEPIAYTEVTALEAINIDEELDLMLARVVADHYRL